MKTATQANGSIVLQLDRVTKRIGNKTIVNDLSFTMSKGEIVGLLGPNGAGKTTTIRMIVGLISMTEGDIRIRDYSIKDNFEKAIRHVGGIIENPEFYSYMTGMDNLKQFMRMSEGVTEARIKEVTKLVGLELALDKKVKTYSLGMRQRLGIAQALLHNPSILILDEPTNGLDPAGIREMRGYMKEIAEKEGLAILVSSHLLSEMEQMCNRVVVVQEGKLVTVRSIGEEKQSEPQVTLSLQVSDVELTEQTLKGQAGVKLEGTANDRITITLLHEEVPTVVKALSNAGVGIYRMEEQKTTLEDQFMKWTEGNRIA
ncbi:ABC transporter ATP-binding protein [Paenibacillus sp. GSMTC-2017]|uniref:ABC transporter ATP-binding protein n=1 Tax=Paenibacillus sp. GSMTC-2017 TaxID=2794350 RepID=UPI0018D7CAB0|nr:ABC transporter ATP-binding protein [Paenibacillus sp. GSMTC-2017]MBH5317039.1 ABC transporter ATP-binding protein [Paenibacillus sp. GSMTC-2017]